MSVFDEIAAGYDDDLFHQVVAEKLVNGVADAPKPDLVLDVATGTGAAAFAALQHLGARSVVAIDSSPRMIERAKAKAAVQDPSGKIDWHVGQAVPAPVQASSADLVVCASSLHFLGTAALKDWLRVLRPAGRLAFSMPFGDTFTPSPAFASLVASDIPLPSSVDDAARIALDAGYSDVVSHKLEVSSRIVFLVYATC
ncbi:SAM-dependent methyltransferase [Actinosynnema sp. ALI-1.44]|uniref:class I SAM-dependent methyltransferase n=1 Tax=Actinosynnema sp. ALI-1.44 TaxID=1933779 RepID=UPI00097CA06A|nr:class I SAM-dependent methyltransferase [Actinosynnema sp. ALI-1.44]ONI85808.1 SAM-dependent methyltransferase [Actinosynnema sp. ALI-1.44]